MFMFCVKIIYFAVKYVKFFERAHRIHVIKIGDEMYIETKGLIFSGPINQDSEASNSNGPVMKSQYTNTGCALEMNIFHNFEI